MHLNDFDLGDDVFATVEVHRSGERYTATGTVLVDLHREGASGTDNDGAHEAATQLLTDRAADINAFLADRYGAALKPETEWEEQAVAFSIDLNSAIHAAGEILDKLRTETHALSFRNDLADESDQGFYRALSTALDRP